MANSQRAKALPLVLSFPDVAYLRSVPKFCSDTSPHTRMKPPMRMYMRKAHDLENQVQLLTQLMKEANAWAKS